MIKEYKVNSIEKANEIINKGKKNITIIINENDSQLKPPKKRGELKNEM